MPAPENEFNLILKQPLKNLRTLQTRVKLYLIRNPVAVNYKNELVIT